MIRIGRSDRVLFLGTTGAGKTVLAKYFLERLNRVIVIDPKHTFRLEGYKLNKSMRLPAFSREFNMLIRPRRDDDSKLAELLIDAFKKRNITIYTDELAVMEERYPESISVLREIALTGREKNVALWNATQRPRGIPPLFKTEAEVFFVFRLQDEDDRKHIAGYVGNEVKEKIPHHHFWYFRGEEESPRLMTLDIDTDSIYPVYESTYREEVI